MKELTMKKFETTDTRISKLISSLMSYKGADIDGDALISEDVISELKDVALKDNPAACRFVFNEMKKIVLEECDFFLDVIDFEIIEKNDRILGRYNTNTITVQVVIEGETNMSIVKTMAHELRHAFQHYNGLLNKSFEQKSLHAKVVEDYMYSLEKFPATEEHVRQVLYRTSWHEIDAQRYSNWFIGGGIGKFKETEDFEITEDNISKELIGQLLRMEKTGRYGD